jgi:hypothetical protein
MTSVLISVVVGLLTFAGGMAGLLLQRRLPSSHMSEGSRDMIGAIIGLVTLLLALVLGTLVGSAYTFYATQKTEVEGLAARGDPTRYGACRIWSGDAAHTRRTEAGDNARLRGLLAGR